MILIGFCLLERFSFFLLDFSGIIYMEIVVDIICIWKFLGKSLM